MQGHILVFLLLSLALTEGVFGRSNCPIKQYSSTGIITGLPLYVHDDFRRYVDMIENLAMQCRVHVYVKGSFYKLPKPTDSVKPSEENLAIGHALQFELRTENNRPLCNKECLSKTTTNMNPPEAVCFLNAAINSGITWTAHDADILSDNKYASDTSGYGKLKTDIQTKCQKENFKRQLALMLRRLYEETQEESQDENEYDEKKKK